MAAQRPICIFYRCIFAAGLMLMLSAHFTAQRTHTALVKGVIFQIAAEAIAVLAHLPVAVILSGPIAAVAAAELVYVVRAPGMAHRADVMLVPLVDLGLPQKLIAIYTGGNVTGGISVFIIDRRITSDGMLMPLRICIAAGRADIVVIVGVLLGLPHGLIAISAGRYMSDGISVIIIDL